MAKNDLKQMQKNADNRDIALLAQEMGFLVERFDEFKRQTQEDFTEIKNNTSGNYGSLSTQKDHEKRISRMEKAMLSLLGVTFMIVFTAVVGLVIVGGK